MRRNILKPRAIILILLTIALILLITLLNPLKAHADEPDVVEPEMGNLFLCGIHALAAEMRNQSFHVLLEGARVLNSKGMCHRDPNWLTSWGAAQTKVRTDPHNCIKQYQCQGYFLLDTIDPAVREPIALAVHVALTEDPQVRRYHFDHYERDAEGNILPPKEWWWYKVKACPSGYFELGDMRFC